MNEHVSVSSVVSSAVVAVIGIVAAKSTGLLFSLSPSS